VKERSKVVGTQVRGKLGERERLSARGDPSVRGGAEHARDAEEHLGLLLGWQRVAQMRVGERARLINTARGME
jgi:hypothetical protein